ncbi:MAG: hypothetical protein U9N40_04275 [Euryarchaeota archaeon]|nr:hypothetical protein [Euryarchaeota archaeon]
MKSSLPEGGRREPTAGNSLNVSDLKENHISDIPIRKELLTGNTLIPLQVFHCVLQLPHMVKMSHCFTGAGNDTIHQAQVQVRETVTPC